MTLTEVYLIALLIIFALPWLVWRVLRTDYWAPLVVVQIIGGVLLGPGVLGAIFPEYYAFVFRPEVIHSLNGVAWWAVMLFVWVAGIELDLAAAWKNRRETGITASLALGMPLLLGACAALVLLQWQGWRGPLGATWQVVLGIGMACAVTALPILILLMDKIGILRRQMGQRVLRYASLDDIAIWAVLALILLDFARIGRQAIFVAGFALAAWSVRRVMERINKEDRWALGLIWLIAVALAADWSGLHYMVGAFLAGVVLEARWFGHEAMDRFRAVVLMTVMPVFFLSTGLRTGWESGGLAVVGAALLLLAAAVGGKLLGVHIAGKLLGWTRDEARLIGWLLQTKALIMIIFANILLDKAIITSTAFTALLLMAVMSTMLTTPMATPLAKRAHARMDDEA
jgi:Kef-type K+ transport system membrane component KefB